MKKIEEIIGMPLEDLNEEKLTEILNNEEISKKLFESRSDMIDFLEAVMKRNQDKKDFLKELFTIRCSLENVINEETLANVFQSYSDKKISREELLNNLKNFRTSEDPIFLLSTAICTMIGCEDVDLKDEIPRIEKAINSLKNYFENFGRMESSYFFRCELVDLIFNIRSAIFLKYGIEINIDWVEEEANRIEDFEVELSKREINENID